MSTFVYNNAQALFQTGSLVWATSNIHAAFVNASYAPQPTDLYLSQVPTGAIVKDVAMTNLGQSSSGVCYGSVPEIKAFLQVVSVVGLLLYLYTGNPATSVLIYYSSNGVGFPFTPQGFNYSVGYDQSNGGFFKL